MVLLKKSVKTSDQWLFVIPSNNSDYLKQICNMLIMLVKQ